MRYTVKTTSTSKNIELYHKYKHVFKEACFYDEDPYDVSILLEEDDEDEYENDYDTRMLAMVSVHRSKINPSYLVPVWACKRGYIKSLIKMTFDMNDRVDKRFKIMAHISTRHSNPDYRKKFKASRYMAHKLGFRVILSKDHTDILEWDRRK